RSLERHRAARKRGGTMRDKKVSLLVILSLLPLIAAQADARGHAARSAKSASRVLSSSAQLPKTMLGVECSRASELCLEKMLNVRAHLVLSGCGLEQPVEPGVPSSASKPSESALPAMLFPPANVNTITGPEVLPHVTQSESMVWSSDGQTIVVNYNDSRTAPANFSGVSYSINSGLTF